MLRYNYRTGVVKQKRANKIWVLLPLVGVFGGGYMLLNVFSPTLQLPFDAPVDATAKRLVSERPALNENRIYIPQINVDVEIAEGNDESALNIGAWHRSPENGSPEKGGNFVLSAHRFNLGFTPTATKAKSPFYHIDQLNTGDQVYVDYDGVRYAYEVSKRYKVSPTAVEIEAPSDEAKLTLYSCDLRGQSVGREVIEAKPIGTIAWVNGVAKLKSSEDNNF
jgi:sortase A